MSTTPDPRVEAQDDWAMSKAKDIRVKWMAATLNGDSHNFRLPAGHLTDIAEALREARRLAAADAAAQPPEDVLLKCRNVLYRVRCFINNGIALGFIRMPDESTPDTAKEVPGLVDDAITTVQAYLEALEASAQPPRPGAEDVVRELLNALVVLYARTEFVFIPAGLAIARAQSYLDAPPPQTCAAPEGWRPIETLPEGEWVLAATPGTAPGMTILRLFGSNRSIEATHWMPLPAAPPPPAPGERS